MYILYNLLILFTSSQLLMFFFYFFVYLFKFWINSILTLPWWIWPNYRVRHFVLFIYHNNTNCYTTYMIGTNIKYIFKRHIHILNIKIMVDWIKRSKLFVFFISILDLLLHWNLPIYLSNDRFFFNWV